MRHADSSVVSTGLVRFQMGRRRRQPNLAFSCSFLFLSTWHCARLLAQCMLWSCYCPSLCPSVTSWEFYQKG